MQLIAGQIPRDDEGRLQLESEDAATEAFASGIPYTAAGLIAVAPEATPAVYKSGLAYSDNRLAVTADEAIANYVAGMPVDDLGRLCVESVVTGPEVLSITNTQNGTSGTSHAANMPATVAAGDLLLALITLGSISTFTGPVGWTPVTPFPCVSAASAVVLSKIADGTEGGTSITGTSNSSVRSVAQVYRIAAGTFDPTVPIDLYATSFTSATVPVRPVDAFLTGLGTPLVIAFMSVTSDVATVTSGPSGYTFNTLQSNTGVGAAAVTAASGAKLIDPAATSETPGDFTLTASRPGVSLAIVVPPVWEGTFDAPSVSTGVGTADISSSTAHPSTVPAVSIGDRLIAIAAFSAGTVNTPAGWTLLFGSAAVTPSLGIFYRDAASAAGSGSVDFSTTVAATGSVVVYRLNAGTFDAAQAPYETHLHTASVPVNTDVPGASNTPPWGEAATLWLGVSCRGGATGSVAPAGAYRGYKQSFQVGTATGGSITAAERRAFAASALPMVVRYASAGTVNYYNVSIAIKAP